MEHLCMRCGKQIRMRGLCERCANVLVWNKEPGPSDLQIFMLITSACGLWAAAVWHYLG